MITIPESLNEFKRRLGSRTLPAEQRRDYLRAIEDAAGLDQRLFEEQGKFLGHFTSHGPDHSARVMVHTMELVDQVKSQGSEISPRELFMTTVKGLLCRSAWGGSWTPVTLV